LEHLKGKEYSENRGVEENNIRMNLESVEWENVDWIHLAQDSEQCRALMTTVMNLHLP
jgi:hypothetical protein